MKLNGVLFTHGYIDAMAERKKSMKWVKTPK